MTYLRFSGGVVTYPYTLAQLRAAHPNVSFPSDMGAELLLQFDVFAVTPTNRPAPSDPITKNVVEVEPVPVNGVWTQQWAEVDASADQVTFRQQAAADESARTTVKADSFVPAFIAMSPAQIATYIEANVASLATAKTVITKLAQMLLLLARREFR